MDQDQAEEFGKYIRQQRVAQGLSGRQLAKMVGVRDTVIMRIEKGHTLSPKAETLGGIADALGLSTLDLFQRANYSRTDDLPELPLYLRQRYSGLPPEAIAELSNQAQSIASRYGIKIEGPGPGEDET